MMDEFFHCDKCDGKKVPNDCNNSDQLDMFAVLIDHFPMVIFKYIYIYILIIIIMIGDIFSNRNSI